MPSHKIERIESDIAKYISQIIATETNDDFLKTITITGCDVASDLSYAKVYFTSLLNHEIADLEKEMNEASKYIRGKLSGMIDIRHTPELHFKFDTSIEYGKKIEKLIEEINER